MVKTGDTAPNFTLKNTSKEDISLSDYAGKSVILAFYPGAFTGVCDKEMCAFQDNMGKLSDANAVVLGISVDSPWANAEFSRKYDLGFNLLSDVDRKVVNLYDATFTWWNRRIRLSKQSSYCNRQRWCCTTQVGC